MYSANSPAILKSLEKAWYLSNDWLQSLYLFWSYRFLACTEWYRTQSVKTIHEFGNSDFLTLSSYFLRMDQLSVDGASSMTEKKKKNYENLCPAVAMVLYFSS